MYIHILPQIVDNLGLKPKLIKVSIPELNIEITENLSTRKPYPNKYYYVGSLNSKKSMIGILFKNEKSISYFTTIYDWEIKDGNKLQQVIYNIIEDQERDLISQDIMLNIGFSEFEHRIYKDYSNMSPLNIQPTMYLDLKARPGYRVSDFIKHDPFGNHVIFQSDTIHLHTVEKEKIENSILFEGRYTHIKDAKIID